MPCFVSTALWAGFASAAEYPGNETSLKEDEIIEGFIYWMDFPGGKDVLELSSFITSVFSVVCAKL